MQSLAWVKQAEDEIRIFERPSVATSKALMDEVKVLVNCYATEVRKVQQANERLTTLEQLLQNIIAAHCGHYADVEQTVAVHRAITEADEFLNM